MAWQAVAARARSGAAKQREGGKIDQRVCRWMAGWPRNEKAQLEGRAKSLFLMVGRGGLEPTTKGL